MASAVKRNLTYSVNGATIYLTASGSVTESIAGNLIHTAVAGTTPGTYDEIWIWAQNNHTSSDIPVNIQWGGSSSLSSSIITTIPWQSGLIPIIPGFILQNGLTVSGFATTGSVIAIHGFVNSITD